MVAENLPTVRELISWYLGLSIFSVSKSKFGCALLDLDFVAVFDYQVFSWVFDVL